MKIENQLLLGNMLEILLQIPNEKFDLIIIDPPYNKKYFLNLKKKEFLILFEKWVSLIYDKLKSDGSFYCFINEDYLWDIKQLINNYFIFKRLLIWNYNTTFKLENKKNYNSRFEFILFFTKTRDYTFNILREKPSKSTLKRGKNVVDKEGNIPYEKLTPHSKERYKKENYEKNPQNIYRGSILGNVFYFPRVSRGCNPELRFGRHPTQKPEKLIEIFIKVSSNEGDLVGDFFVGSGTTLVVAKKLRRKYFGCEIKPEYYEIAKKRLDSINVFNNLTNYSKSTNKITDFI